VVTIAAADIDKLKSVAGGCPMSVIGTVKGESLSISIDGRKTIDERISDLETIWANSLKSSLDN
jgi:hypothetical protein